MTPETTGRERMGDAESARQAALGAGANVCEVTRAALLALRFDERLAREIAKFRDVDCPKDYPETAAPLAAHRRDAQRLVAAIEALGPDRARDVYARYHRSCAVPVLEEIRTGRWKEAYELYHRCMTRLETELLEGEETRGV
ncbi:MAG: hypothetical protein M3Q49_12625 [Actinomycetota bacterium]|nr:hypothetical protein [Actinomycetota bacterium]